MKTVDILEVKKGDIVRFKSYALRVEQEPIRSALTSPLEPKRSTP